MSGIVVLRRCSIVLAVWLCVSILSGSRCEAQCYYYEYDHYSCVLGGSRTDTSKDSYSSSCTQSSATTTAESNRTANLDPYETVNSSGSATANASSTIYYKYNGPPPAPGATFHIIWDGIGSGTAEVSINESGTGGSANVSADANVGVIGQASNATGTSDDDEASVELTAPGSDEDDADCQVVDFESSGSTDSNTFTGTSASWLEISSAVIGDAGSQAAFDLHAHAIGSATMEMSIHNIQNKP